jgi:hypothetical protein
MLIFRASSHRITLTGTIACPPSQLTAFLAISERRKNNLKLSKKFTVFGCLALYYSVRHKFPASWLPEICASFSSLKSHPLAMKEGALESH